MLRYGVYLSIMCDTHHIHGHTPLSQRQEVFIDRARARYGDRFDYSRFVYVDKQVKGTIICRDHGAFDQTPQTHLKAVTGCPTCSRTARSERCKGISTNPNPRRMTAEDCLGRLRARYGDLYQYDMTGYQAMHTSKIKLICQRHGEMLVSPHALLSKKTACGCPKCGRAQASVKNSLTYGEFLERSKAVNGDRYSYPESNESIYVNFNTEVDIICRRHGPFKQHAGRHSLGKQCRKCSQEDSYGPGLYKESFFVDRLEHKDTPGALYYAEINGGQLFKIGITRHSAKARLDHCRSTSGGEITAYRMVGVSYRSLYDALVIEQQILDAHEAVRARRPWSTELFSKDIWPAIRCYFEARPADSS